MDICSRFRWVEWEMRMNPGGEIGGSEITDA